MTQQQLAISYSDQILQMIGPHGIFAIIGTILLVRMVRVLWYLDQKQSLCANLLIGSFIGACAVYFFTELSGIKCLLGGAFMTVIGSIIAYELSKFALGFLYEKTGIETFRALFFFLSPKPIKAKREGKEIIHPPHSELTRIFDATRLDKKGEK